MKSIHAPGFMWAAYATVVVTFLIDLWLPLGIAPGVLYTVSIVLALWLPSSHHILVVALMCTLFTVLDFYLSPPEAPETLRTATDIDLTNRALVLGMIWMVTFFSLKRGKLERALQGGKAELEKLVQERTVNLEAEIHERRRLESALQNERDLLLVTLASIGDGVIATDTAARVTFINPVAETLLGWPSQGAVGHHVMEVLPLLNEHTRTVVANPIERVLQEGVTIGLVNHTVVLTRDGREVPVADSGAPIRSPDGKVYGAVLVFRDVTEQRDADVSLRQAKEQAEVANRAKSEFLGTVSHELRTPLNVILGYSTMLLEDEEDGTGYLTPAQVEIVRRIDRNARELFALITTVLDLQRLETGRLAITRQAVSVPEFLNEVNAETQGLQNQPGRAFQWQVEGSLPLLYTDPGKLKVVLKNLIGNAVKFTPQGTVTVQATRQEGGIEISVTDTGIGIPSEALARIFEAFQQVESPHHSEAGGVGLGLHIVKRLLELLGGTITVDSELGRGSTFRVWLPHRPLPLPSRCRPES